MIQSLDVSGEDDETKRSQWRQRLQTSPRFRSGISKAIKDLQRFIKEGTDSKKAVVTTIA